MDKLKVLIVDDSFVYRRILIAAVENTQMASLIETASNGVLALDRMQKETYDTVLMDVNMPEMDGIETLKRLKVTYPSVQVIMISSKGGKSVAVTLDCLQLGAMDFIVKPVENDYDSNMKFVQQQLKVLFGQVILNRTNKLQPKMSYVKQIDTVGTSQSTKLVPTQVEIQNTKPFERTRISGIDLVLIAASTGGPVALETLLSMLSVDFITPILIVQHMPADFTKALADNLNNKCHLKVMEGSEGDTVRAGQVMIAPGGFHMLLKKAEHSIRKIGISKTELVNGVRPAADVLFRSVAKEYSGARILTVILTGMGMDGKEGVAALKQRCNCYCIAQSEASSVVYGMPGSVVKENLCDEVLDLGAIAKRMLEIRNNGS